MPLSREADREGILGDRRGATGDCKDLSPEGHGDCREVSVEATVRDGVGAGAGGRRRDAEVPEVDLEDKGDCKGDGVTGVWARC